MGWMRFSVANRQALADAALQRIYMSGVEEIPWKSRVFWDGEFLVLERDECDSGNVHVPWPCGGLGEMMLTTASLMERPRPYLLEVELARGTINLIRNQVAAWRQVGLIVPAAVNQLLADASRHFAHAATTQHAPAEAAEHAHQAIAIAVTATRQVGKCYTQQALQVRRQHNQKLTTLFAVNLGSSPSEPAVGDALPSTFNTALVPIGWRQLEIGEGRRDWTNSDRQIEWCQRKGLRVCGGPLLQMDPGGVPDWTYLWEGDLENLLSFMLDHVRAVVRRYRGKVHLWQVAGRVNCGKFLALSEQQRLRVVVRAIECIREVDQRTPLVVSFDQPWGEYLARDEMDLAPLHFADALARGDLGLSGLGLEINTGYFPQGTLPHTLLDYSRQLDRWSTLGLPLMLMLTAPSGSEVDPHARVRTQPMPRGVDAPPTPDSQRDWIETFVPLMLAKNCVQVICWNQLRDRAPHDFPHGGLFDAHDQPKPALEALKAIRQSFLA